MRHLTRQTNARYRSRDKTRKTAALRVGHDLRFSNEVFHFWQDRREPWSVLEIGRPNPVDLDGLGVDWPIRVDPGAPRLALAPALAVAQHFDETDFDDDAGGSPGGRLARARSTKLTPRRRPAAGLASLSWSNSPAPMTA
jgi:hypothetical protein